MAKGQRIQKKTISKYRKNQYRSFIKKLGMEQMLPKLEKEKLFWEYMEKRYIVVDYRQGDFDMPPHTLDRITNAFEYYYTTNEIGEESPCFPTLTVFEAFMLAESLVFTMYALFTPESKVRKAFAPVLKELMDDEYLRFVNGHVAKCLFGATSIFSSLENYIYGYEVESHEGDRYNGIPSRYRFIIQRKKAPNYSFTIDDKTRSAYKLLSHKARGEFYKEEMEWNGKKYKVYIQPHALRRFEERLTLDSGLVQLKFNAGDIQFDQAFEFQDRVLIPVISSQRYPLRIGYLLCAFTEKVCLVKTFLFISQNGTPEGEKLNELLAINKIDKAYLELDKQIHFTRSDLREDELLRPIFEQAKLDHLFEIEEGAPLPDFSGNATFIKEMLQLN